MADDSLWFGARGGWLTFKTKRKTARNSWKLPVVRLLERTLSLGGVVLICRRLDCWFCRYFWRLYEG